MATALATVIGVALLIGFILNVYYLLRAQQEMALVADKWETLLSARPAGGEHPPIIKFPQIEPLELARAAVWGRVELEWLLRDEDTKRLLARLADDLSSSSTEGEAHE